MILGQPDRCPIAMHDSNRGLPLGAPVRPFEGARMMYSNQPVRRGILVALPFFVLVGGCAASVSPAPIPAVAVSEKLPVAIGVDQRMELLAIIWRLAGAEEFNGNTVPAYADAINTHFAPYKSHPTVLAVADLRKKHGISHNAVADLAVRMTACPDLRERAGLMDGQMDKRWNPQAARDFMAKVRTFAVESNAAAFFEQQRPLYDVASRRLRDLVEHETDLDWIYRFYGGTPKDRFIIVHRTHQWDVGLRAARGG